MVKRLSLLRPPTAFPNSFLTISTLGELPLPGILTWPFMLDEISMQKIARRAMRSPKKTVLPPPPDALGS